VLQVRLAEQSNQEALKFDFTQLEQFAQQHDSEVFFAGRIAGQVVLSKAKQTDSDALPFITDVTVVIKSSIAKNNSDCFASDQVKDLLPAGAEFFAAHIKRTM